MKSIATPSARLAVALVCVATWIPLQAQDRPNFTGTWTFNASKSDLIGMDVGSSASGADTSGGGAGRTGGDFGGATRGEPRGGPGAGVAGGGGGQRGGGGGGGRFGGGRANGPGDVSQRGRAGQARGAQGRGPGRGAPGGPLTIKQSESQISIGPNTYTFADETAGGNGLAPAGAFKAHWDGRKLVIESVADTNDTTIRTREVRSLNSEGKEMTVDISTFSPAGEHRIRQVFNKN